MKKITRDHILVKNLYRHKDYGANMYIIFIIKSNMEYKHKKR